MGTREARNSKVWAVTSVRKSEETHKRQKQKFFGTEFVRFQNTIMRVHLVKKKCYITTDTDLQD